MNIRIHIAHKASQQQKDMAMSQASFYEQLKVLFNQQFAQQQQTLNFLMSKIQPILDNPTGYFEGEEAALRTQASDTIAQNYQNAARNWQQRAFQLGGRELPGGALLQGLEALALGQASEESGAQNQITLQGAQRRLQNFWNAASALGGVAQMQSPNALLQGSIQQGENAYREVSEAFKPSGIWQKVLAGVLTGIGTTFLPGLGTWLGGSLFGAGGGGGAAAGAGAGAAAASAPSWGVLGPSIYGTGPIVTV